MKKIYRKVSNERETYLLSESGYKYTFRLCQDEVTKEWEYFLDTLPELMRGSSLLYGKSVKEIISNLNMSEAVIIKDWNE